MPAGAPNHLSLGNGFYRSDSLPISSQQCNNCYPNYPQTEAESLATLFGTPGLLEMVDAGGTDTTRGQIVFDGNPYQVNGTTLSRMDETAPNVFALVTLGTITGTGRVSMAINNTQICILIPGGDGFIFSVAGGLVTITDLDFRANGDPQFVVYIDGFFVFTTDTNKIINSSLQDGTSYLATDFGSAEVDPDAIVAPFVHKNQLFIMGQKVTEVFQNIGGSGFPFQRIEGFIIDKGLTAPFAIVAFDDAFIFLGAGVNERPAVWRIEGSTPSKISHTAIDTFIQTLTDQQLANTFANVYSQDGAYFAILTADIGTVCFDSTATISAGRPIWHTRTSNISSSEVRWRPNTIVTAFGKLIAGDGFTGQIGELERTVFTEYDNQILRTWSSPPIDADSDPVYLDFVEVTMETGVAPEGVDADLGLSISKDGGKTYGAEVFRRSSGKIGEFFTRLIWNRLGRSPRIATFQLTWSAAVKFVVIKFVAEFDTGQ